MKNKWAVMVNITNRDVHGKRTGSSTSDIITGFDDDQQAKDWINDNQQDRCEYVIMQQQKPDEFIAATARRWSDGSMNPDIKVVTPNYSWAVNNQHPNKPNRVDGTQKCPQDELFSSLDRELYSRSMTPTN